MITPIVTPASLTAHLSGDQQAAIDAATGAVRDYCRWHVTPVESETIRVRGNGSTVLQLPTLRVVSVTSVADEDGKILDNYKVADEGYLYGRSWAADHYYTVALEHGFEDAPALTGVILRAAAGGVAYPTGGTPSSVSLGSARIGFGSTQSGGAAPVGPFPAADLSILDRYRLPALP